MKVLLIGEYSNVHWTLAEGLRALGHKVTVLSNGDFFKNYPRDIDLTRRQTKIGGIAYIAKLLTILPRLRGYDIVQLINPMFLELKAERIFPIYRYLRRHNGKIVLGGYGMDYYWVNTCITKMPLRYSDFNIGSELRTNREALDYRQGWIGTTHERLNRFIAEDADAIVTGLYEYHVCYQPAFPSKTTFIPFPIKLNEEVREKSQEWRGGKVKVFIGINVGRSAYKGTDIMLRAVEDVVAKYPEKIELVKVCSVPFARYSEMMEGSDIILDQLYSYTPAMNALLAMSKGIIVVGGGEPEHYELLGETELRPIINVTPSYESVFAALEDIALHPERIPRLSRESIEYVRRHHDYIAVAKAYERVYTGDR